MKSGNRGSAASQLLEARETPEFTPSADSITYSIFASLTIERFKSCDFNKRIKHAFQQIVFC